MDIKKCQGKFNELLVDRKRDLEKFNGMWTQVNDVFRSCRETYWVLASSHDLFVMYWEDRKLRILSVFSGIKGNDHWEWDTDHWEAIIDYK